MTAAGDAGGPDPADPPPASVMPAPTPTPTLPPPPPVPSRVDRMRQAAIAYADRLRESARAKNAKPTYEPESVELGLKADPPTVGNATAPPPPPSAEYPHAEDVTTLLDPGVIKDKCASCRRLRGDEYRLESCVPGCTARVCRKCVARVLYRGCPCCGVYRRNKEVVWWEVLRVVSNSWMRYELALLCCSCALFGILPVCLIDTIVEHDLTLVYGSLALLLCISVAWLCAPALVANLIADRACGSYAMR
jgi:hypothetical protein